MPLDVWRAIVEKMFPYVAGAELVGLGEPTLSPLFSRACADVLAAGKTLYIATNGLTLGSRMVLDAVGDTPRVSVSIDAWDAESYKRVRGEPEWNAARQWAKLIDGVRKFRKAKPRAFLHSQYTGHPGNIDGLPKFVELAAGLGFQEVLLRPVHGHSVAREDYSLRYERDRTEAAIDAARDAAQKAGIMFIAERPSYSSLTAGGSPAVTRIKRYLDFVPLATGTCPVGTATVTGNTTTTASTTTSAGPAAVPGENVQPVVIRSARREPTSESTEEPQTIICEAPIIVAANGDCWSCFGRHVVGNILTDDWHSIMSRPRYQEFLRNRVSGQWLKDAWCRNCPRVM